MISDRLILDNMVDVLVIITHNILLSVVVCIILTPYISFGQKGKDIYTSYAKASVKMYSSSISEIIENIEKDYEHEYISSLNMGAYIYETNGEGEKNYTMLGVKKDTIEAVMIRSLKILSI